MIFGDKDNDYFFTRTKKRLKIITPLEKEAHLQIV